MQRRNWCAELASQWGLMDKANKFFNPDDCPFEVLGFFERLINARTGKALGTRTLAEPTRKLGSEGYMEYDITQTVTLRKGHKEFVLKASLEKPVRVIGMIEIICGKVKPTLRCTVDGCGRPGKKSGGDVRCPAHIEERWRSA